jgi:hypothetical protein
MFILSSISIDKDEVIKQIFNRFFNGYYCDIEISNNTQIISKITICVNKITDCVLELTNEKVFFIYK